MNRKRLIAFMLMLFLYSGTLFAQKVTISFHNESMSQALKRLERVSGDIESSLPTKTWRATK